MAKIKVHELAKELDKQSRDILSFLQEKGIEAKVAQSSVDEEAAQLVRKHFAKSAEQQAPQQEGAKQQAPEQKAAKAPAKKPEKAAEEKKKAPEDAAAAGSEKEKAPEGETKQYYFCKQSPELQNVRSAVGRRPAPGRTEPGRKRRV